MSRAEAALDRSCGQRLARSCRRGSTRAGAARGRGHTTTVVAAPLCFDCAQYRVLARCSERWDRRATMGRHDRSLQPVPHSDPTRRSSAPRNARRPDRTPNGVTRIGSHARHLCAHSQGRDQASGRASARAAQKPDLPRGGMGQSRRARRSALPKPDRTRAPPHRRRGVDDSARRRPATHPVTWTPHATHR